MQKIVVPIDFSVASSWGYYYAYEMAKHLNVELVVIHLYWPPYVESTYPMEQIQAIYAAKEEALMHHIKAATRPPVKDAPDQVRLSYVLKPGSENTIVSLANELDAELIIMGTHGSGKALDKVWGTNTGKVIQDAECPVIAVPEGAIFKPVQQIAYATDFDEKDNELLFQLAVVATAIKATVHCVHVNRVDELYQDPNEEAFRARFEQDFKGLPVSFSNFSAETVEEGLQTFCRVNDIHILAMLTHHKTLWDKIFWGGSTTKSMSRATRLPLLAFHK
jgi:nucleotide-binding universal stress UspA family protein